VILAYIEQLEEEYENLYRKLNQKEKFITTLKAQVAAGGGGAVSSSFLLPPSSFLLPPPSSLLLPPCSFLLPPSSSLLLPPYLPALLLTLPQTLGMTYKEVQKKLSELQSKLFSDETDPAEAEVLNIEYEKLTSEMEKMPEFLAEQKKTEEKWKRENYEANKYVREEGRGEGEGRRRGVERVEEEGRRGGRDGMGGGKGGEEGREGRKEGKEGELTASREAFGRVLSTLQKMQPARRDAMLKKEPCLVLLGLNADRIKKKHKNDWVKIWTFFF
jgi:hypothetical protein